MSKLTHIDGEGQAHMVDVSGKGSTERSATAEAFVRMTAETLALIAENKVAKGDVLATARIAGIMAAKKTSELIPLCHPLNITSVTVDCKLVEDEASPGVHITATAKVVGVTGVEMEALTAASVAALTIYDMVKAVERGIVISDVRLVAKEGGRSGVYRAAAAAAPAPMRSIRRPSPAAARKPKASEVPMDGGSARFAAKDHSARREAFRRFMTTHGLTAHAWAKDAGLSVGVIYSFLHGRTPSLTKTEEEKLAASAKVESKISIARELMLSVADASQKVVANLKPLPGEHIPLVSALGRVLASNVKAKRTQPPLDISAMDGYAVKASDVAKLPAKLKVVGSIAAGQVFAGAVKSGEAARIFTGAPIPRGADTIVIQENTKSDGAIVEVVDGQAPSGKHIRRAGLDFREGDVLLQAGHRLTARDLALAAAMNHTRLEVRRQPRVAILATGDELVPPGTVPGPGQIVGSSSAGLSADVIHWGGTVRDLGIAHDEITEIRFKSEVAQSADLFVTLGGASVGDHDLIQKALADDLDVAFWKIAMRPGKPLIFGRYKSIPFLGLPGNPVSAMVCAQIFLKPMIHALIGYAGATHELRQARLTKALAANDERQDYVRAAFRPFPDGGGEVEPFAVQDSSMMRTMAAANALLVRPPRDPARAQGDTVSVLLLD